MTIYRDVTPADRRFVISTWSSSYKNAQAAGMICSEDWPDVMHLQISKLLDRPGTRTIVAHAPPTFLYGFICGDMSGRVPVVHYVYVKAAFRSQLVDPDPDADPDPSKWSGGGHRSGPRHARGLFAALGVDPAKPFLYTCKTAIVGVLADPHLANKIPLARFKPQAARYANYHSHEDRDR